MADYPYSPELKAPGKTVDFDLSRPGTLVMLKLLTKTHLKQTDSYAPPEGVRLRQVTLGEVPCFLLEPEAENAVGTMVLCHGGAFYLPIQLPTLELAAFYAKKLRLRLVVPQYRLVPEHPAPAAFEDCLAVWQALSQTEETLLLYGESAGGALAAGLALYIRDHGLKKPRGQVLIYPVLDNRPERYPSATRFAEAGWSARSNASMWEAYLKNAPEAMLAYLIPMQAADRSALPDAYIEPQQIDILCDEALAYGRQLAAAGIGTQINLVCGSYHGFDADLANPFVQRVLARRLEAMTDMINNK